MFGFHSSRFADRRTSFPVDGMSSLPLSFCDFFVTGVILQIWFVELVSYLHSYECRWSDSWIIGKFEKRGGGRSFKYVLIADPQSHLHAMWLNVGFLSSLISEDLGTDGVERSKADRKWVSVTCRHFFTWMKKWHWRFVHFVEERMASKKNTLTKGLRGKSHPKRRLVLQLLQLSSLLVNSVVRWRNRQKQERKTKRIFQF